MTIGQNNQEQATGLKSATLTTTLGGDAANCMTHSVAIDTGDATSGTITVTATATGNSSAEPVYENGSALVINIATTDEPKTRTISNKSLSNIIFTPSTINGTGNWTATVVSKI